MRKMFKYTPLYANGKEPVIEEQDVYRIEIPYVPTLQGRDIDTTQKSTQKILDLIRENPYVTAPEMADSIGIIRRTVAKHIRSLQDKGIIKHWSRQRLPLGGNRMTAILQVYSFMVLFGQK